MPNQPPVITLQEFVSQALVEVMNGLSEAQKQLQGSHARICPILAFVSPHTVQNGSPAFIGRNEIERAVSIIDFDVAVSVGSKGQNQKGLEGRLSVFGASVGVGGEFTKSEESTSDHTSRIRFSVPVCYPELGDSNPPKQVDQ